MWHSTGLGAVPLAVTRNPCTRDARGAGGGGHRKGEMMRRLAGSSEKPPPLSPPASTLAMSLFPVVGTRRYSTGVGIQIPHCLRPYPTTLFPRLIQPSIPPCLVTDSQTHWTNHPRAYHHNTDFPRRRVTESSAIIISFAGTSNAHATEPDRSEYFNFRIYQISISLP